MPNGPILVRCRNCKTLNRVPETKVDDLPLCGKCKERLFFPRVPVHGNTESFDQQIQDWPETLVVEFWAKWCGHCRAIELVLNSIVENHAGRLKILKIDVDAEPGLVKRFSVHATPTFITFRNGRLVSRLDGAPAQKSELLAWFERAVHQ
jgi:thioredoxin 2